MNTIQFNQMVEDHTSALRSHALKFTKDLEDANDLVQDTLIKAIRFYQDFKEGTNFKGWLYVIMRNTFINDYRKNTRKNAVISQVEDLSSDNLFISATENEAGGKFAMKDIQKALASIPDTYSIPFTRYFEGYKYHEIADELNIPLGTVKTRIQMAREMLKKYLKNYR